MAWRIFLVSTNPENGQCVAFDAPDRKVVAYSENDAIAGFVERYVPSIEVVRIDTN